MDDEEHVEKKGSMVNFVFLGIKEHVIRSDIRCESYNSDSKAGE